MCAIEIRKIVGDMPDVCFAVRYHIKVIHGDCEWILYRRFKHFRSLHDSLWVMRQMAKIPVPTKGYTAAVYCLLHVKFKNILYVYKATDFKNIWICTDMHKQRYITKYSANNRFVQKIEL